MPYCNENAKRQPGYYLEGDHEVDINSWYIGEEVIGVKSGSENTQIQDKSTMDVYLQGVEVIKSNGEFSSSKIEEGCDKIQ